LPCPCLLATGGGVLFCTQILYHCFKPRRKSLRPEGVEIPPQNAGKTQISQTGGAKSGALSSDSAPIDPDLQRVLEAWPMLPAALRSGILAMIDAACKDG
jgi:hypothetical protein